MNFRQRVAWVCLSLYLATSCAVLYYFLDIADQYATFSLAHSKVHEGGGEGAPGWMFWRHVGDVPFGVVVLVVAVPYLQVFAALFYCTLSSANANVNKCLVPVIGWMYMFQKAVAICRDPRDNLDTKREHLQVVSMS